MKHTLISILLIAVALPCAAQWKTAVYDDQILAFGAHDTTLFISVPPFPSSPASVLRFVPNAAPADHWVEADSGIDFTQGNVTSFASLGKYFFAGMTLSRGGSGTAYRSTNNGSNWSENIGAPIGTNGTYLFGTFGSNVALSRDSGKSWVHLSTVLPVTSYAAIGVCIFATTANGVWRSKDTGNNWSQIAPPVAGIVTPMDSLLFIVGNGELAESADSGSQWNQVAVDSSTMPLTVNVLATDGKNLFAGTTKGVYLSRDAGKTWIPKNEGLTYLNVDVLGVFDTLLFVNTPASSIHYTAMRSIPEMIADTGPASVVQTTPMLDSIEVYPNPATGTVTIRAGVAPILDVQVLNIMGSDVLDLTNQCTPEIAIDLSKHPSGTYFIHIQTAAGSVLRKITLER